MSPRAAKWQPTPVGLCRDRYHRYFWNAEGPMVSVTTAIGVVDKPTVYAWAKRETAACAVRNIGAIVSMVVEGGPDAAVDWLKRIPDYKRDKAADLGTRVHKLAERIATAQDDGMTISAVEMPYVRAYRNFIEDHQPEFLEVEFMVASLRHRYGGTGDLIARMQYRGQLRTGLLDIKSGNATYGETALQFAGLRNADFIGRPDDPEKYPIPAIDFCAVVHLQPELYDRGYEVIPYRVTRADFGGFLAARRMHRWVHERAKHVKGNPLTTPIVTLPSATEEEVLAA